jgi:hypothetical protein
MKKTLYTLAIMLSVSNLAFAECIFHKPVEIRELSIGNLITWSTISEKGNGKFIVEKSMDGFLFKEIGKLDGAGDSQDITDYRFLDLQTGEDEAYYRLKVVDKTNYESITHTIFFNREHSNNYAFNSMSSPTTDSHFTLLLDSKIDGKLRYRVVNQKGQVLLSKARQVSAGENMISVNITDFPNGRYKLETILGEEVELINLRKVAKNSLPNVQYVIK